MRVRHNGGRLRLVHLQDTRAGSCVASGGVVQIMVVAMEGVGRELREWFLARDGRQYGPITQRELNTLQTMGELRPDDLLWRDGWQTWKTATALTGTTVVDRRVESRALVPTKPDELQDWAELSPGEFKSLRVLSPILNFLIMIGLVAKPLLEHFGKRSDAFSPWALFAVPFLFVSVFMMFGTAAFFFQRASQNINTFAGRRVLVPVSAWLMCVPIVNSFAIPSIWARTYYYSLSFLPEFRITRSRAAAIGTSAFAFLVAGQAFGLMSGNTALWPNGYDAMSLAMIAVSLSCAGAILFSRIVQRVHIAQEAYAQREGLTNQVGVADPHDASDGLAGALRLATVGLCIVAAAFTGAWPVTASLTLQRLLTTTAQIPQPAPIVATREEIMRTAADQVNKDAPQMVDEVTRLDGARVEGDQLIYEYTLLLQSMTSEQFERLSVSTKSRAGPAYCEGEMEVFRDLNARIVYRYRYPNGWQIGQIVVTTQDCWR